VEGGVLPPRVRSDLVRTNIAVVEESATGEGGEGISEISEGGEGGGTAGRLRVRPYHDSTLPPHGCPHCPPNMCKGVLYYNLLTPLNTNKPINTVPQTCVKVC
jgi:hypothetical protein